MTSKLSFGHLVTHKLERGTSLGPDNHSVVMKC